jgi:hypothetical protein
MFSVSIDGSTFRCGLWTKLMVLWWERQGLVLVYNPKEDL